MKRSSVSSVLVVHSQRKPVQVYLLADLLAQGDIELSSMFTGDTLHLSSKYLNFRSPFSEVWERTQVEKALIEVTSSTFVFADLPAVLRDQNYQYSSENGHQRDLSGMARSLFLVKSVVLRKERFRLKERPQIVTTTNLSPRLKVVFMYNFVFFKR